MDLGFLNGLYYIKTESMLNEDDYNSLKRLQKSLFFKYLKTRNYGYGSTYLTLDNVINFENKNLKNSIINDMKDDFLMNVYNVRHDITNIKLVYKSVKYDIPIQLFDQLGSYSKESLEQFFKYNNTKLLPKEDVAMFEAINLIESDDDQVILQEIEKLVFKFTEIKILKKGKKYKPLYEYIQLLKLTTNLKTFLKLKIYDTTLENFTNALYSENYVGISKWVTLFESNNNDATKLVYIYFNEEVSIAFSDSLKDEDGKKLIESLRRFLLDKIKELSYKDNTIAPILYYIHLKDLEAKKVRRLYYDK